MTDDDRLVASIRAHLEATAEDLDEASRRRLQASRRRAVGQSIRPVYTRQQAWLPAVAVAVLAALTLTLTLSPGPPPGAAPAPEYLELLAISAPPEVLDDLEFLEWLAGEEEDAG